MKQILLLLFLAVFAAAQNKDTVQYSADKVVYSKKDTVVYLIGRSKITYKKITMTADSIAYHSEKKILIAAGHPIMIDGTDTLTGDYIAYNLKDETGKVRQGVFTTKDNLLYGGERIARGKDEALYIDNGSYTTSQGIDSVHYYFYGKNIKMIPNKRLYAKPFILNIEESPSLALPLFMVPLEQNRRNGFLQPRWGVQINGRGSVDNVGYYWAPNDYIDFTAAAKIDNFTSYIVKGGTRYAVKNRLSGAVSSEYSLNDRYLGGSNRWSLDFNHNQIILPDGSLTLKGSGRILSDKKYNTDYSEDTSKILDQNLSSNASLTKTFKKLNGYGSLSWDRSQNLKTEKIESSLPTARFSISERPIIPVSKDPKDTAKHWYNTMKWSYTAQGNQKISECRKPDSSYYLSFKGFSQSLPISIPIDAKEYFTFRPFINMNHSIFDAYSDTTNRDTVLVYTVTFKPSNLVPIQKTRELDYINNVASGTIKVYDTLFPPKVNDTIVRVNPDSTAGKRIIQDTTYWHEPEFALNKANNFWWDAGTSLSTRIYGIFPITIGPLTGIRHTMSPSITYRFTPKKDLDVQFPSTVGISSTSGTKQRQDLTYSLNNLFEARWLKDGKDKKASILSAGISGGYNFEEEKRKFANYGLSASIPTNHVDLSYSGTFSPYNSDTVAIVPKALNHSLRVNPRLPQIGGSIWSGDFLTLEKVAHDTYMDGVAKSNKTGWSMNISPRYNLALNRAHVEDQFAQTRTYNLGGGMQIDFSHRWKMRWNGDWSFTEGTFINQSVSLYADLESWEMKFDWYPTGLNSGRFYFLVNIKKHRDIQWMKRQS